MINQIYCLKIWVSLHYVCVRANTMEHLVVSFLAFLIKGEFLVKWKDHIQLTPCCCYQDSGYKNEPGVESRGTAELRGWLVLCWKLG